jgi:hypothetical protein
MPLVRFKGSEPHLPHDLSLRQLIVVGRNKGIHVCIYNIQHLEIVGCVNYSLISDA